MSAHKHTHTSAPFADQHPALPLAAAIFCLATLAFLYQSHVAGVFDIGVYTGIGESVWRLIQGAEGGIGSEYPPLATALFLFSYINPLRLGFATAWIWMVVAIVALAGVYATYVLRDRAGWLIPATIAGTVFFTGPELVFGRYDVLVAALVLLSLRARSHRNFAHCAAFLAAACALKVVPALLIPVLFCTAPRSEWKRMAAGFCIGLAASFAIPAAVMGVGLTIDNVRHMIDYHSAREVQLESSWSGVHMALKALIGQRAPVSLGHLSVNNNDLGPGIVTIAKFLILGVSVGIAGIALLKRRHVHADTLALGILLFAIAASPVFSPQYIVWVLPLALSWLAVRWHVHAWRGTVVQVALLTAVAGFGTQWVFPLHYTNVIDQEPLALAVLNVRNAAVLLLAFTLFRHALFPCVARTHRRQEFVDGLCRLTVHSTMLLFAVLLLQGFRHEFLPRILSVNYSFTNGMHGAAPGLRFSLPAETETSSVAASLVMPLFLADGRFYLSADDCFTSFRVNGNPVPEAAFCGDGRVVDLSAYLQPGRNLFLASVLNHGGPTGIIIAPATLGPVHLAITVSILLALLLVLAELWSTGSVWLALRSRHQHPVAIRSDVRRQAAQLLHLPLLDVALPA